VVRYRKKGPIVLAGLGLFFLSIWIGLQFTSAIAVFAFLFEGNVGASIGPRDILRLDSPAVAYHPKGFRPGSESSSLSRTQIIDDLELLKTVGFNSLVTYGASGALGFVPEIARQVGFDGTIIMGLWDPLSEEESYNALAQAPFVDGYCLGNEGLGVRYKPDELRLKMAELRRATRLPVTTTEPIDSYLEGPYREWLLKNSDWLFPLAQPFLAAQRTPHQAVSWIVVRHDYLTATSGRVVILKEIGYPTAGAKGSSEEAQRMFFEILSNTGLAFFYFEAFDQPWKRDVLRQPEVEAHWGLYRADGTPKKGIAWLSRRWAK
jgi:exo-beta-1,3-glucanase (GH17 family)